MRRRARAGPAGPREHAATARELDPPELTHGRRSELEPRIALAALPLVVVSALGTVFGAF
ncbi:hypothetical protein [Caulobacter sp. 17J80-11]|uniref:hypothetical protein n=1 Tax=Caulobacter sp. 17J80-11 TaxID=2763502 RepID=UPI001653E930|nr:hypothetical protein [Caulobacter sp. 17J80-11]MBC6982753.1 hypothetical protein [Caulobacter sp. 17J80-11]